MVDRLLEKLCEVRNVGHTRCSQVNIHTALQNAAGGERSTYPGLHLLCRTIRRRGSFWCWRSGAIASKLGQHDGGDHDPSAHYLQPRQRLFENGAGDENRDHRFEIHHHRQSDRTNQGQTLV